MRRSRLARLLAPPAGLLAVLLAGVLLTRLAPPALTVLAGHHPGTLDDTLGAAGQLGAAVLAAWALLALGLAGLATTPGAIGQVARAAARAITPALARQVMAALVGLAGAATPLAPALATPATGPALAAAAGLPIIPSLDRPAPQPLAPRVPVLDRDSATPPASGRIVPAPQVVVVRPGDTLWSIAARGLGPHASADDIARAWPRWYRANRALIGPDPGLLHPGQHLRAP